MAAVLVSVALIVGIAVLRTAFRLPANHTEPKQQNLGESIAERASFSNVHSEKGRALASRIHALGSGKDALSARFGMVDAARRTINLQYYIWHRDLTGLLLLSALRRAADRGVQVRLLLDDNGIEGLDDILGELADHPNFQVKLYNPFVVRKPKAFNYLFDFNRLNRRMHNKSMTIDGLTSITGGRNIGDEYFDTGSQALFVDLDVVVIGDAAEKIEADFERYWTSGSSYDFRMVVPRDRSGARTLNDAIREVRKTEQFTLLHEQLLERKPWLEDAVFGSDAEEAQAIVVSDIPDKTLGSTLAGGLLIDQLISLLDEVEHSLDLVSPYFVPGRRGLKEFTRLSRRGVRVRILTNSLEANDVSMVHAGYAKYRRRLLNAGVELFELKAHAAPDVRREDAGTIGSSGSSLHAKTFAADRKRVFVGSFNFDPRSVWLNTEMGLVIDSPKLAQQMHEVLDRDLPRNAYRLSLNPSGQITWDDLESDRQFSHDPNSNRVQRTSLWLVGKLPIEWLL